MDVLKNKLKATTLIETIISFVVLGIILGSSATLFIQVNRSTQLPLRIELHYKLLDVFNGFKNKNMQQDELSYKGYKIKCSAVTEGKNGLKLITIKGIDRKEKTIDEIKSYIIQDTKTPIPHALQ